MKIGWQMDYLVWDAKSGIFKYRRRVPRDLQSTVGQREIIFSLRTKDEGVALTRYGEAHSKAEAMLGREVAKSRPQMIYEATLADLKATGLLPKEAVAAGPVALTDDERFNAYTAAALSKFDAMTPAQLARPLSRNDTRTRIVMAGFGGVEKPKIRLAKAVKLYLDVRQTKSNAADLAKQCELVRSALSGVMGEADPLIQAIDDDAAEAFRDKMVKAGSASGTVRRRVATIRAILTFVKKNNRLKDFINPFVGFEITNTDGKTAKERRDALSLADIRACVPAIVAKNQCISDLWILMMFTGARPKELTGLLWTEIDLQHPTPHFQIQPNRLRPLKTDGSKRKVPLVGAALDIVRRRQANLAIELAPHGIRINAVAPAVVETPVYNTFLTDAQVAEVLPTFNAFHPLGRNGQPRDVAEAILFLASDQASWITGTVLPVDGGVTAGRQ